MAKNIASTLTTAGSDISLKYYCIEQNHTSAPGSGTLTPLVPTTSTANAMYNFLASTGSVVASGTAGSVAKQVSVKTMRLAAPYELSVGTNIVQSQEIREGRQRGSSEVTGLNPGQNFNYELGYNTHDDFFITALGDNIVENKSTTSVDMVVTSASIVNYSDETVVDNGATELVFTISYDSNTTQEQKDAIFPINTYLQLEHTTNVDLRPYYRIIKRAVVDDETAMTLRFTLKCEGARDSVTGIGSTTVTLSVVLPRFNQLVSYRAGDLFLYNNMPYVATADRDSSNTNLPGTAGSNATLIGSFVGESATALTVGTTRKYIHSSSGTNEIRYARVYRSMSVTADRLPTSGANYTDMWSLNNEYAADGKATYAANEFAFHDNVAFVSRVNDNTDDPLIRGTLYQGTDIRNYRRSVYQANANVYGSDFVTFNSMFYRATSLTEFQGIAPDATNAADYWESVTIATMGAPRSYTQGDLVRNTSATEIAGTSHTPSYYYVPVGAGGEDATLNDFTRVQGSITGSPRAIAHSFLGGTGLPPLVGAHSSLESVFTAGNTPSLIFFSYPWDGTYGTPPDSPFDSIDMLSFYFLENAESRRSSFLNLDIGSHHTLGAYVAAGNSIPGLVNLATVDSSQIRILVIVYDTDASTGSGVQFQTRIINLSGSSWTLNAAGNTLTLDLTNSYDWIIITVHNPTGANSLGGPGSSIGMGANGRAMFYRGTEASGTLTVTASGSDNSPSGIRGRLSAALTAASFSDTLFTNQSYYDLWLFKPFIGYDYDFHASAMFDPNALTFMHEGLNPADRTSERAWQILSDPDFSNPTDNPGVIREFTMQYYVAPPEVTEGAYIRDPNESNNNVFYYALQTNTGQALANNPDYFRRIEAMPYTVGVQFSFLTGDIFEDPDMAGTYKIAIRDGHNSTAALSDNTYFQDFSWNWIGVERVGGTKTAFAVNEYALGTNNVLYKCLVSGTYTTDASLTNTTNWMALGIRNNSPLAGMLLASYAPAWVANTNYAAAEGVAQNDARYWLANTLPGGGGVLPDSDPTNYKFIHDYTHSNIGHFYNEDGASNAVIAYKSSHSNEEVYYRFFNPTFAALVGSSTRQFRAYMTTYNIFPTAVQATRLSNSKPWVTYISLASALANANLTGIADEATRNAALIAGLLVPFRSAAATAPTATPTFGTNFVAQDGGGWQATQAFDTTAAYSVGDFFHEDGILYEVVFARAANGNAPNKRFPHAQAPDATFWANPIMTRMGIDTYDPDSSSNTNTFTPATETHSHTESLYVDGDGNYLGVGTSGLPFRYSNRYLRNGEKVFKWNMEFRTGARYIGYYNTTLSQLTLEMGVEADSIVSGTVNFVFNIAKEILTTPSISSTIDLTKGEQNSTTNRPFATDTRVKGFFIRHVLTDAISDSTELRRQSIVDSVAFTRFNVNMNLNVNDVFGIGYAGRVDSRPGTFDMSIDAEILAGSTDPFFVKLLNTQENSFELSVVMEDSHGNRMVITFPSLKVGNTGLSITSSEAPQTGTYTFVGDAVNSYNTTMQIDYLPNEIA